jgi:predicted nuclease of restriction endonuclease-like (RecB) superfamily
MREAASQSWTTRALERQIGTLYYERLLSSSDRTAVEQEANSNLTSLQQIPREFVRDPVMLEFLGLSGTGKLLEADLEQALLDNLQAFLLELGRGFHSWYGNFASAPNRKISISKWCSITTFSSALYCSI